MQAIHVAKTDPCQVPLRDEGSHRMPLERVFYVRWGFWWRGTQ